MHRLKTALLKEYTGGLFGLVVLYLCSAETHADGECAGKGQLSRRQDKTRHQNNADIFKTVCVCPQQQEADWRPFERR